ncbi:hypothetical protein MVEN_01113500 [Mycena venus]|uniref:Uncharacterized protein n=1 Tax=Mycena venus TaxID=2733690 RepID=A0A8H6Y4X7_9AGAR|nr:hypothetical protein MVEN_01113500 [Mycena venus]
MSLLYKGDKPYSDTAVAEVESLHADSPSRSDREGPSRLQWLVILSVCIMGGWVLANTLYTPKDVITVKLDKETTDALGALLHAANETHQGTSELAVRGLGASELAELDKRALNPFATFTSGNAGVKVGLIVGGVGIFNMGVSNCDQGHFGSCVTGILSGLLLTAAGLWAPVPGRRSLGLYYNNATIAIADHDPTSDHPAHRFITNYLGVLDRNPTFAYGANIGFVHYARTAPSRHRLVIQPNNSTEIGRRQDGTDNDGGSVSYEWTDFGSDGDSSDRNPSDYDSIAGGVAGYIQDNEANNICLTQCIGTSDVYEVGQIQTQAGTDPSYDTECEFSDQMVECGTAGD